MPSLTSKTRTLSLSLVLLAGCAGTQVSPPTTPTRAKATTTILWPAPSRLIPVAANSITVRFLQGSTFTTAQTVARPTSGNQTTLSFESLPLGAFTVQAEAYPTLDGTGVAQTRMSTTTTILAGQTNIVSLTMASTIGSISLTSAKPDILIGETTQLSVTAHDASGNLVLISPTQITWTSLTPALASVSSSGLVTGVFTGAALIQATEMESGRSATIPIEIINNQTR